jgi:hypothetical protein
MFLRSFLNHRGDDHCTGPVRRYASGGSAWGQSANRWFS